MAPVIALMVVSLAAILILIVMGATQRNAVAIKASQQAAQTTLNVLERKIGQIVLGYAKWHDAFEKMYQHFDLDWAHAHLGPDTIGVYGIDGAFVIGPDGTESYAIQRFDAGNGGNIGIAGDFYYTPSARTVSQLGALIDAVRHSTSNASPIVGLASIDGDVSIVAVAPVVPTRDLGSILPSEVPVLVFTQTLGKHFLRQAGKDHQLSNLHLSSVPSRGRNQEFPLTAFGSNRTVGYLAWTPEQPGNDLLGFLIIPFVVLFAILVSLLGVIRERARRMSEELDQATQAVSLARDNLEAEVATRTAELYRAEKKYRSIFENASEGLFQMDREGCFLSANPAMARILGCESVESVLAFPPEILFGDRAHLDGFLAIMDSFGVVDDFECRILRLDGEFAWISQSARAIADADGTIHYYQGIVTDITARKEAEERLVQLALHDPLTDLPNKTLFLEHLQRACHRAKRKRNFAVFFIDVDRFKLINDSLGHGAGDVLLIALSKRLAACLRTDDTLARFGGDEFAVLAEGIGSPSDALNLAERLHDVCAEPFDIEDRQAFTTLSIGIAFNDTSHTKPSDVLREADTAMYRAKARGGTTTVLFETEMHAAMVNRLRTETEFRQALERNELVLFYQPIVSLATSVIVGFEALIRWPHAERGIIPPGEFIPMCEETGLIIPLGEWVLRQAALQMQQWRHSLPEVPKDLFMSVNLSPLQISDRELPARIQRILAQTGANGRDIKLEVTETAMMASSANIHATLATLLEMGIRLSIDDFGTGFSSLSQLSSYPFDTLKIDRSFVSGLTSGRKNVELLRTILALGKALKLAVVAEGIETALQQDWLRAEGCTFGQGYLFAHPLETSRATALLRSRSPVIASDTRAASIAS